jgi:hypothetical protein
MRRYTQANVHSWKSGVTGYLSGLNMESSVVDHSFCLTPACVLYFTHREPTLRYRAPPGGSGPFKGGAYVSTEARLSSRHHARGAFDVDEGCAKASKHCNCDNRASDFPADDAGSLLKAQRYDVTVQNLATTNDYALPDVQAIFFRRHQPRRPPLANIRPGRPAPAMGPGTEATSLSPAELISVPNSEYEKA